MKKYSNKLALHQETLRRLTHAETGANFFATHNTCVRSVCGPACTPAAAAN
ncbi:MAG TPA: hypothetical protein VNW97_00405 [Candidatus Saccharimonadales bacterium]|nr:hypothetical protein [Candidatus Saccharimonadales bacterium]